MRPYVRFALWCAALAAGVSLAQAQSLIPQTTAARYGLTRAWFAQVGSQQVTGTLKNVNFDEGLVLVQSTRGMLTAIDAETGRTLWATQVGERDGASSEPAANGTYVVVINGSWLFVLNRADGSIEWQRRTIGSPGAGPGVSHTHAFIPMINGLVEGYDLAKGAKQTPWNYQSSGRLLAPPMTSENSVSWTTERGYFYVADPAGGGIRYRLETGDEIHSRPSAWSPRLFAGSADGYVYALDEKTGHLEWKFPAGEEINETPAAIQGRVYAVTVLGGMYCLDAVTGTPLWHVTGISKFISASPTRVYAADTSGKMAILDARGGVLLGKMPLNGIVTKVSNSRSDRIFLVSISCVVQCLHETQLATPVVYTPPKVETPELKLAPKKPAAKPAAEPANAPAEKPAKSDKEPPADKFFDDGKPADAPADAANPFAEKP